MPNNPYPRLAELTEKINIRVFDVPHAEAGEFAGAVGIVDFDEDATPHGMIGLADDLDAELRCDVLAFAIAIFVGDIERILNSTSGSVAISRERLAPATEGVGHLAWHMLFTCGRTTSSATFETVPL